MLIDAIPKCIFWQQPATFYSKTSAVSKLSTNLLWFVKKKFFFVTKLGHFFLTGTSMMVENSAGHPVAHTVIFLTHTVVMLFLICYLEL